MVSRSGKETDSVLIIESIIKLFEIRVQRSLMGFKKNKQHFLRHYLDFIYSRQDEYILVAIFPFRL